MAKMPHNELTRLQGRMAVASFAAGTIISMVCIFFIPPLGEISSTAMMAVSEFLVLCGGLLGFKANYDTDMQKFRGELMKELQDLESKKTDDKPAE